MVMPPSWFKNIFYFYPSWEAFNFSTFAYFLMFDFSSHVSGPGHANQSCYFTICKITTTMPLFLFWK